MMFRFNCSGKPIFDERFQEAINKWAKAKGIDPDKVFEVNGWAREGQPKKQSGMQMLVIYEDYKGGLVKPVNTSVFEEAIIDEQ